MSTGRRHSARIAAWLAASLAVGGMAWGVRELVRPRPSLDEAVRLAELGSLDEAEAKVRALLAREPGRSSAHLLLAQILLGRPEPPGSSADAPPASPAAEALEHLGRVRPENARMAVALHLGRGKTLDRLLRVDEAEAAWLGALEIDPTAPEAGWNLLNLYYLQGREEEARRLALRLHRAEPDPHDRALLLLELVKLDARPPAPGSLLKWLEPVVARNPEGLHSSLALGLALTRSGKPEEGIDLLRRTVAAHPARVEARDALLTALDEAGDIDLMEEELKRLPAPLADSPSLCKHRARVAQGDRWEEAVELYRRAQEAEPYHRVVEFRLSRALRHVGEVEEAERIDRRVRRRDVAIQELRPLYDRALATPSFGIRPHPELYREIAEAREAMQLLDEARAWHRLVLRDAPDDAASLAALARLGEGDEIR